MRNIIDKRSADSCLQGAFQKESPSHRYPFRTKVTQDQSTMQQLEATNTKEYVYPILNFDQHDVHNLPNELKCEDLIKSEYKRLCA